MNNFLKLKIKETTNKISFVQSQFKRKNFQTIKLSIGIRIFSIFLLNSICIEILSN